MDDVIDWDDEGATGAGVVEFVDGPLVGWVIEFPDVPPLDWDVITTHHRGYTVHHYRLSEVFGWEEVLQVYEAAGETHWEEEDRVETDRDLDACLR